MSKHKRHVRNASANPGAFNELGNLLNGSDAMDMSEFLKNTDTEKIASMMINLEPSKENENADIINSLKCLINSNRKNLIQILLQIYLLSKASKSR